jgi:hypothetical protein
MAYLLDEQVGRKNRSDFKQTSPEQYRLTVVTLEAKKNNIRTMEWQ